MLKIKEMNNAIVTKFEQLTEIRSHMRNQYKEYLEKNKTNKVFGLDSFHYQSRLLDLESKHLYEQYYFINNRMYCDYYKLYGMVKGWYKDPFKLEPKKRSYPPYKDLEQYTVFEFTDIHNLDIDISEMLKKINDIICKKEEETLQDKKSKAGLNIDNYIHHNDYNNTLLRTKMNLYEKYLTSYHIYHMSFLSHLMDRVLLLFRQNTNTVKLGEIENWVDVPVLNKEAKEDKDVSKENNPFTAIKIDEPVNLDVNIILPSEPIENIQVPLVYVAEPVAETVEPVAEPVAEPIVEPVTETVPEPVQEPVEPVTEPVQEPVEPVTEPVQEPVEPVTEPVTEPIEYVTEPVTEPIEYVTEPVVEHIEYVTEPIVDPVLETDPVKSSKKKKKKK
jgi:hypothetical protein